MGETAGCGAGTAGEGQHWNFSAELRHDEVQCHISADDEPHLHGPHLRTHLRVVGFSCYSCWLFFSCYSCWLFFSCFSCWLCHCYVSLLAFLFLLGQVRSGSVRLRERYVGSASCRRCGACPTGWERQLERPPVDHLWSGLCSECFSECYITDECSEWMPGGMTLLWSLGANPPPRCRFFLDNT